VARAGFGPFCSQAFESLRFRVDCKSVHAGSIPAVASTFKGQKLKRNLRKLQLENGCLFVTHVTVFSQVISMAVTS
jgi:hypothetical protein